MVMRMAARGSLAGLRVVVLAASLFLGMMGPACTDSDLQVAAFGVARAGSWSPFPDNPHKSTVKFLHVPKSGTTWIAVIRNSMRACKKKDFTCNGILGGTVNHPDDVGISDLTCNGRLVSCLTQHYHEPWTKMDSARHVVTMVRQPNLQFVSMFKWMSASKSNSAKNTSLTMDAALERYSNMAVNMLAGYPFFTNPSQKPSHYEMMRRFRIAQHRLLHEVAWFGISNHWRESVCLYHAELGGQPRESEFMNTRPAKLHEGNVLDAQHDPERVKDLHLVNQTQVLEANKYDNMLYHVALSNYRRRSEAAGCASHRSGAPAPRSPSRIEVSDLQAGTHARWAVPSRASTSPPTNLNLQVGGDAEGRALDTASSRPVPPGGSHSSWTPRKPAG